MDYPLALMRDPITEANQRNRQSDNQNLAPPVLRRPSFAVREWTVARVHPSCGMVLPKIEPSYQGDNHDGNNE